MDKISLPFRILLVVFLAFAVAVVRRPAAQARGRRRRRAVTTAPGVTGLANDAAKAQAAPSTPRTPPRRAARPRPTRSAARPPPPSLRPRPPSRPRPRRSSRAKPAKPRRQPGLADDAAPGDPSRPLLASVDAGKVVVLLFWNKNASDDRATRQGLRSIDLHGGKVVASAVPIDDVGRYEAITRGVQVLESPTVLVIGAGGKARAITGYTQAKEIDQAVSDIGGKGFEAKKAFRLQRLRQRSPTTPARTSATPSSRSPTRRPPSPALSKALGTGAVELGHSRNRLAKAKATTADERKLKAALVAFADQDIKWVAEARSQLKAGAEPGTVFLTLVQRESDGNDAYVAAAKKLHVRGCYANA